MTTSDSSATLPARRRSRDEGLSSSTRAALLDNAERLFTENGYAGTSLEEVVAASEVTKGALYHHFPSKLALFDCVFDRLLRRTQARIENGLDQVEDPWERALEGLRRFLAECQRTDYRRICLQEAPAALGRERWIEAQHNSTDIIIDHTVNDLLANLNGPGDLAAPLGAIFLGAMRSSGEYVADAGDPDLAAAHIEMSIAAILAGLRSLKDLGAAQG